MQQEPYSKGRSILRLFLLLPCLIFVSCFSFAQDKVRFDEVNRIWMTYPLYAGMIQVDSSQARGFGKAFVSKSFRSQASYEDVKRFYVERLSQDGWQLVEERPLKDWQKDYGGRLLTFHRGEYSATIEYCGERADVGWNYAIGIGWGH